jgi:hypothetical protein
MWTSLVARCHQDHVREGTEIRDVEGAVVGRAVVTHQPGAIHGEHDVQALEADVVDDLVEGPLEEGRVDGAHGLRPLEREAGGEQHRVLLRDPDVVVLLGDLLAELVEAGPPRHRRGDPDHPAVALGLGDHRVGEHGRVLGRRGRRRLLELLDLLRGVRFLDRHHWLRVSRLAVDDRLGLRRVPLLHALEAALLGRGEALALDRVDVDDHRALRLERVADRPSKGADVVAVDDAHVGEVELLEHQPRRRIGLDRGLQLRANPFEARAEPERQLREHLLHVLAGVVELRVQADALEIARQRADVGRDRHPVVVQDDDDGRLEAAGVVQGFIGDPPGEGAVADDRHHAAVLADPLAHRLLEADGIADRRRGVTGAHDVVLGLEDRAERRQASVLADRVQPVAPSGEHLVRVGLMADVPQDLVPR